MPYVYTFKVFAKERWIGKRLLEVLLEEFRANDEHYYVSTHVNPPHVTKRKAIEYGLIFVEGKDGILIEGNPDYLMHHSDRLVHQMHRHEPPVTSQPIKIVYQNESLLVIDKPSSIPVCIVHLPIYFFFASFGQPGPLV